MNTIKKILFFTIISFGLSSLFAQDSTSYSVPAHKFSHTICKFYTDADFAYVREQENPTIVWEKSVAEPFNELIVSWNALRPTVGFMTIWVSVKYKGEWSSWHRLAQWGSRFQRTFVNKLNRFVHTKHCRVEMQKQSLARGFRVKVVFNKGAQPENLRALFGCASRLNHFKFIRPRRDLPSVAVKGLPRQSQMVLDHPRCRDLCSPTSTSMIAAYYYEKLYGIKPTDSMHDYAIDFAEKAYDQGYLDIYGNWILNVAQAFDSTNGQVYFRVERLNSFYDLYHYLSRKIPVAVSVRRLRGGATPYANGHILVVVGWNRQKGCVLCVDPAFNKSLLKAYPLNNFLRAWSRSSNLAYVPMPR
jgi:hypothetical protein